jgi:hypothetical protein
MTEVGESTAAAGPAGAGAAERGAGWPEQMTEGVSGRTTGGGDEEAEGDAGDEESEASGTWVRSSGMARGSE